MEVYDNPGACMAMDRPQINIGTWRSLEMVGREQDNGYGGYVDNRDYPSELVTLSHREFHLRK